MKYFPNTSLLLFWSLFVWVSCKQKNSGPSAELIKQINLKRGDFISCGGGDKQFGSVDFETTCDGKSKKDFDLAIELLHSFEYDESEKAFARVIDATPECAMAYWGVAMCNFHPLWNPPTEAELRKGSRAIEIAIGITKKSGREAEYISAIAVFYKNWDKAGHRIRCLNFEKAMENLHTAYPGDKEAAIFYALALDAAAEPTDKTYANQKKAGSILTALYPAEPNHPGVIHYIIHTYDYPGLASLALPAARKYASVAPSSAHALHMPSHIFTRLGLWNESIKSNLESVSAAKCYAESAGIKGHWDEELHGIDYLVYAYLQKGENELAKEEIKYLDTMDMVYPFNFKVAYAFAASPARFFLENKQWSQAALLQIPAKFPLNAFPWQEAIIHFTRLLGAAHLGNMNASKVELAKLNQLYDTLWKQKDIYKARQVEVQKKTGEAWILFGSGDKANALNLMKLAADIEDSTEKHPVTPGEVLPARELLGDMLMQVKQNENALKAYETVLTKCPNRFNSLYGAGVASERSGDKQKASFYYRGLLSLTDPAKSNRPELAAARSFLSKH
ncbi:MAG: hypothetical protein ABIS01_00825 [Ferruginibacter sp.]